MIKTDCLEAVWLQKRSETTWREYFKHDSLTMSVHLGWNKIASDLCVGAKNNGYREFRYDGATTFTNAMKLVHKKGEVGCVGWSRTKWGCTMPRYQHATNIIVTGTDTLHTLIRTICSILVLQAFWFLKTSLGLMSVALEEQQTMQEAV